MELIINKDELKYELDKAAGKPNFDNAQDEILWTLKKHEPVSAQKTHQQQFSHSQRITVTESDIIRENSITLLDDIKNIIRIVKRILKGDIYAKKENTNWVIPYDAINDILYVGGMTEKEFNSIKKKWGI